MKALVLAILLVSLVGTLAVRRHTRHRLLPVDTAHKIANAVKVLDDLERYSTDEALNEEYWNAFFRAYDVDENGLTKEEFHHGIDAWTIKNGFGHQSKPGTDAIFDQLNEDGNDVLTIDEAVKGSSSIFGWYKMISQNVLRLLSAQLNGELALTRCTDTAYSVAGFQVFPAVSEEIGASWDVDGDGQISQDEAVSENNTLMDMLFLEHLSDDQVDDLFAGLDEDGDGALSLDQASDFIQGYLRGVIENACPDQDVDHIFDSIVPAAQ